MAAARKAEALPHLSRLTSEYANSKFAAPGRALMEELARQGVTPPPPSSAEVPARGSAARAPFTLTVSLKHHLRVFKKPLD